MSNRLINETSPYLLQHAHNPVDWYPWGDEALNKAKKEDKPILVSIGYSACHWCHVMERESFEKEDVAALMNEHFINIKVDREERPDVDHIYMDAVQAMSGSGGWPLNVFLTPDGRPFYGGTYFPPRRALNRASWTEVLTAVAKSFKEKRDEIDSQADNLTQHLQVLNEFGASVSGDTVGLEKMDDAFQAIMKLADKERGGFGRAPKFPQTFTINFLLQYSFYNEGRPPTPARGGGMTDSESGSFLTMTKQEKKDNIRNTESTNGSNEGSNDKRILSLHNQKEQNKTSDSDSPSPRERGLGGAADSPAPGGGRGAALHQALLSLDKMLQGGIYDHIGGGFARYATDREWLVPHFEKMLYDNALLVSSLADAYRLTNTETYKQVIEETLSFVERELMHPDGGFYSALDADSEGEEGKFYVWEYNEVKKLLGAEADLFCEYYGITTGGNWEGKSIPWVRVPLKEFARQHNLEEEPLAELLADGKQKLLQERNQRVRPGLDDKVLLNWNALMNSAYSKAYAATGKPHYKEIAKRNMVFLLSTFGADAHNLHHSWKAGRAAHPPFLDDYAFLIEALIQLAQVSADYGYLDKAEELTKVVLENYADENSPYFFYTGQEQTDILLRKKEFYDGATPSGNAVMAANLYHLGILLEKPEWRKRTEDAVQAMGELPIKYPTSFGVWLFLLYEILKGTAEIAIVGGEHTQFLNEILQTFLPPHLVMAAPEAQAAYPLLSDKNVQGKTHIFLCRNYVCQTPVTTVAEVLKQLSVK